MAPDAFQYSDAAMLAELAELAKLAAPPLTPARQREGFAAISVRLAASARRSRVATRAGMIALAAAAVTCALWVALPRGKSSAPTAIRYRAEAGEILDGGYLRSFGDQGMTLRFSEGTKLALLAGARGRLRQVDDQGGHLAIEQGPARIEVTQRPGTHWLVDAGPFLITVKGTVFTVSWDARSEQLDLRMEKGLVSVAGPMLENVISVRAGQQLAISLPKKEVVLHALEAEPAAAKAGAGVPSVGATRTNEKAPAHGLVAPAPRAVGSERGRLASRSPVRSYGWAATLAAGEADSILRDVERLGLKHSLAEASSDDLSALADAARYRRQEDLARQALLAQRGRFPGSSRACDAAFLLGRLEESHEGRGLKALEWYDQYLEGAPTGAYASEALGRKMIATQKLMGNAAACVVALEYLARFPTGTYAGAARALRQSP